MPVLYMRSYNPGHERLRYVIIRHTIVVDGLEGSTSKSHP